MMSAVSFRPAVLSPLRPRSAISTLQRHSSKISMSINDNIPRARFTQVVSDVDDTLKSSGGVNVGGVALGGIDVQVRSTCALYGISNL